MAVVFVALFLVGEAKAATSDDAHAYLEKATGAFGLGRYADAATDFEKAFELKPDPAVLYNAAQSHRLAGHKERALELYKSYLRTYGKKEKRAEIEARIGELEQAIEHDKTVANSPPVTTEPTGGGETTPHPVSPPSLSNAEQLSTGSSVLVTLPAQAPADDRSVVRKPWFWVAVGGGVAVAVIAALLLTSSGSQNPTATFGKANGN